MTYTVDFNNVSTVGLESSPVQSLTDLPRERVLPFPNPVLPWIPARPVGGLGRFGWTVWNDVFGCTGSRFSLGGFRATP